MKCKVSLETALLTWLGRFSVGLALLSVLGVMFDPVLLLVSFLALILGGFSAIAGKLRYVAMDAGIVAATLAVAAMSFMHVPPEASLSSVALPVLRMIAPPYLVAAGLAAFGRWRLRRAARLDSIAAQSADG